jgi:hypothetical protein
MTPQVYALFLAVAACVVGGALGGFLLAGGALLLAHAGAALSLGYAPLAGAMIAAGLALGWLGWAAGGLLQPGVNRGGVTLAVLIGASLLAPFWSFGRILFRGVAV